MDQYIGKVLGNRYEILEQIGSGGMALVYKARCQWLNRFVAIKILKDELAQDEEFRRRFHEESQAVAMLSHPNIVAIYDVSRAEDAKEPDYIVMELIDGITLKQYMQKRGGALSWKEALHFITQIMKGLSHAHSRGIIHRDIKPHNIMILRDGSVKVADFGIARLTSSKQSTMTQEALGSVHYISPEQAKGSHIDCRSDIYSAGVVLYEMLTGRLPFEGDTPVSVAIQHISSIPLSPRELDPGIPEALEEITMKAMAPDMQKRYPSADAMLADLEEFRKNPNISFDYSSADLTIGVEDEPTRPVNQEELQEIKREIKKEPKQDDMKSNKKAGEKPRSARQSRREKEDDYYYDDEPSGVGRFFVILLAVLLCLGGVVAFLWNTVFSSLVQPGETFEVPKLIGYTLEEARGLPEVVENGFTVVEGDYVIDENVAYGIIVDQTPSPGDTVKAGGQQITVSISSGNGSLVMPDLYNKDQRVAQSMLENMGLVVDVQEGYSEEIAKGNVMSQTPGKDTNLEPGAMVTIVVSKGKELLPVTMISLIGQPLEEAERILTEELGLRVGPSRREFSSEYEAGLVIGQSVNGGEIVLEQTAIQLVVSLGPNPAFPPVPTDTVIPSGGELPGGLDLPDPTQSPEPTAEPSVKPTPEPTPTPKPTPTPEPTPAPVVTQELWTKQEYMPRDRETVTLMVTVGGVAKYRQEEVDTQLMTVPYTIEGIGVQEVVVYIDGEEMERFYWDFGG